MLIDELILIFRYLVGQYVTIHDNVISHVNITNVMAEDGGLYACTAKNAMGSIYHSARLNIYGKLERFEFNFRIKIKIGFQKLCWGL